MFEGATVDDLIQVILALAAVFCGVRGQVHAFKIGQLEVELQKVQPPTRTPTDPQAD